MPAPEQPIAAAADGERLGLLRLTVFLSLGGMVAAWWWAYAAHAYRGRKYPYDTFLFAPYDRYNDLYNFFAPLSHGDPYSYWAAVYPPAAYLLMEPFRAIGREPSLLAWLFVVGVGATLFVHRQLTFAPRLERWGAAFALAVLTYPFAFAYDRLNIEGVVTVMLAGAVVLLQLRRPTAAAALIGAAGAVKGYPLLLGLVFLARRDVRSLVVTALTAGLLTVLGSAYYGFDVPHTLSLFGDRLALYQDVYVVGDAGLAFGCSLFGLVKIAAYTLGAGRGTIATLADVYVPLSGLGILALAVFLVRLRPRLWETVTLLILAIDLLPTVSADYKLLHLVIPVALFFRHGADYRRASLIAVLWAVLLVPKAYWVLYSDGTNLGSIVNPLAMLAIAGLVAGEVVRRGRCREPAVA